MIIDNEKVIFTRANWEKLKSIPHYSEILQDIEDRELLLSSIDNDDEMIDFKEFDAIYAKKYEKH